MHTNSSDVSHRNSPDFSIYITHGGSLAMKGLARNLSKKNAYLKDKPYLLAIFEDGFFSLLNSDQLASAFECDAEEIPTKCTKENFILFINWIKQQCFISPPCVMLCADPNLGVIAGQTISELFLVLVEKIDPKFLFACSGTPECLEDVNNYLTGQAVVIETKENEQVYRLPCGVVSGACDKDKIRVLIESSLEHNHNNYMLAQLFPSDVSTHSSMTKIRDCGEVLNSKAFDLRDECSSQVAQYDLTNDTDSSGRNNTVRTYKDYLTSCLTCFSFFRTTRIVPESPNTLTINNTEWSNTNHF